MNINLKHVALIISISLNVAVLSGYLYGVSAPKPVESRTPPVPPGLRDPNLTPEQIQSIKKIQASRDTWLRDYSNRYRNEMLGIVDLLDAGNPDWSQIEARQNDLVKIRREYQRVQIRGWSDIHGVLTPAQGKQYLEALREIVRSLDYGHAAGHR